MQVDFKSSVPTFTVVPFSSLPVGAFFVYLDGLQFFLSMAKAPVPLLCMKTEHARCHTFRLPGASWSVPPDTLTVDVTDRVRITVDLGAQLKECPYAG